MEKMNIPPNGPKLPMATFNIKNPEINSNYGVKDIVHTPSSRKEKKGKGKREKLTKADIGSPTNFRHIAHVEWKEHIGFDLNNLAAELKCLFEMCGIGFTERKGSKDVKYKIMRQSHLPVTAQNYCAPTPPPTHASIPIVSTCPPPGPPPNAPPLSMVTSRGDSNLPSPGNRPTLPPPPLPPGPPNFAPPNYKVTHMGDTNLPSTVNRSALLAEIRESIQLKEVKQRDTTGVPPPPPPPGPPPSASPLFTVTSRSDSTQPSPSNRSALLTQIREGIKLKKVKQKDSTRVLAY